MKRNLRKEAKAFDAALVVFENNIDEFVYAINTLLKRQGDGAISRQAVMAWRGGIPAERVLVISAATGGKVLPSKLRQDLYA